MGSEILRLVDEIRSINHRILSLDPTNTAHHALILQLSRHRQEFRRTLACYRQLWHKEMVTFLRLDSRFGDAENES